MNKKMRTGVVVLALFAFIVMVGAAISNNTLREDWLVITNINTTNLYINNTRFYPANSGSELEAYNGTWIAHGLGGDPAIAGSIALSLRGPSEHNATRIYRVPTVLSSNSTHFQIEFLAWETVGWTLVPVGPTWNNTVWWTATYIS